METNEKGDNMPNEGDGEHTETSLSGSDNEATVGPDPQDDEVVLDEVVRGMLYATLAVTDDNVDTLKTISKTSPWQFEAIKLITGASGVANSPLSQILRECLGLELDYRLDVSGVTIGGTAFDTQGYIAHNEKYIVLSYSCGESAFDWLENYTTTQCAFQPEEDLELEYSPFTNFDSVCRGPESEDRVHAGFYNNFLASFNMVQKYIDPFLQDDRRPRKLFITGHSLGAGIATLAAGYFLHAYEWNEMPHTLVSVSAGSPRVCNKSMVDSIEERRKQVGESARFHRIVKGKDIMTTVPPTSNDFHHVGPPVYISDKKKIIVKTDAMIDNTSVSVLKELTKVRSNVSTGSGSSAETGSNTKYDTFTEQIPRSLRDHLPDSYLRPLLGAMDIKRGKDIDKPRQRVTQVELEDNTNKSEADVATKPKRRSFLKRLFCVRKSKRSRDQ